MKKIVYILILTTLIACNNSEFELCGLGITKPYYYTGLSYKGGVYEIETQVSQAFEKVKTNSTGIAKIRFKINCKGNIGDLEYEEYDLNYMKTNLNDSIEILLTQSITNLTDWIPGKNSDNQNINSHSFLSFRIIEGEITEILPK